MKLSYALLLAVTFAHAQVGIGTSTPTAALDVNGNLRIRTTTQNLNDSSAKDSVLVVNNNGTVARVSAKQIVNSYLKSFVKGNFSTTSDKSLSLSSGVKKIPFDNLEFDLNNEFSTSSNQFTAKQQGIYEIYVQIKASSSLSVTPVFGLSIQKNATVIARCGFANLSVLSTDVSTPFRSVSTLISLNAGDTVSFNVYSSLVTVGILGTPEDCFFTIHQVR